MWVQIPPPALMSYKGKFDNTGVGCLIKFKHKLLLIKRAYYPWAEFYTSVTGLLEENENPLLRIRIETKEEVGLNLSSIRKLREKPYFTYAEDFKAGFIIHMYEGTTSTDKFRKNPREVKYARWFTKPELINIQSELAPITKQILFDYGIKNIKLSEEDLKYLNFKGSVV